MDLTNKEKIIEILFKSKVHLGHKKNRVHPKAKKYIYTFQNDNSIIDLEKTYNQILLVKNEIKKIKKNNQKLLFVGTKSLLAETIKKYAIENNFPYLTSKWPAGFFTNFETMLKNIKKLNEMIKEEEEKNWNKLPKHEQLRLKRELNKLKRTYEGVINLSKLPEAVFIVDFKREINAFKEANKMKIKTLGICDTNFNPDLIDFPIVANDDLLNSVETVLKLIF